MGQSSEYGQAGALIESYSADYVIADRGYDSDHFVVEIESEGSVAVIPPRRNRKIQREYNKSLYKLRNRVERLFQRLKNYRRIATRYERLGRNYMAMLSLVASLVWLD